MDVIKVSGLKKYFEVSQKEPGIRGVISSIFNPQKVKVKAVDGISFNIQKGELVGFIGPNGAGKTTTMKVLSGLLYPTGGKIDVLGFNPWARREEFLRQITIVFGQKNQLWWDLPAMDSFLLNRAIYGVYKSDFNKNLQELVKLLEVGDLLAIPVRKLSLGQRMRLELIAALLHRPRVLFLDEPTIGLDVVAQEKIREFIASFNKKTGSTILLTSHYMGDIERLAGRIIIINEGKLIFDGKLDRIIRRFAKEKVISAVLAQCPNPEEFSKIGKLTKFDFPRVEIRVPRGVAAQAASELLQKFPVVDLTIEETPIEEIIRGIFASTQDAKKALYQHDSEILADF